MVAREQGVGLVYFLQDRLSTRLITDTSGNLVGREDHLPFGEDAGTGSGQSEKYRFTSYERDSESGSDYALNRQYSNATGRFNRPDPLGRSYEPSNPQSFNRYAYVDNDPINSVDPLGLIKLIGCSWNSEDCFGCTWLDEESGTVIVTTTCQHTLPGGDTHGRDTQPPLTSSRGGGGDDRVIGNMLNICGTASSYGQYSNASNGMWRSTLNGKSYPLSWGGNGATGARSLATGAASAFKVLGKAAGVLGSGLSFYQMSNAFSQGNNSQGAKFALDGGVGLVGTFGGPYGAAGAAIYFGVDMTVGWERVGQELMRCDAECQYRLKHCTFANK